MVISPNAKGKEMKVYTCKDHDAHWPVGVASVIIANNEEEAKQLLDLALIEQGLGGFDDEPYTLEEMDITEPGVEMLCNGSY